MDQQRDSGWIEPLEATALSVDEEIKTQTPVSVESTMNGLDQEFIVYSVSAGVYAGAPLWGQGGVVRLPP